MACRIYWNNLWPHLCTKRFENECRHLFAFAKLKLTTFSAGQRTINISNLPEFIFKQFGKLVHIGRAIRSLQMVPRLSMMI